MEVLGRLCLPTEPVKKRIPVVNWHGVSQGSTVSMILCFNLFRDFIHEILQRTWKMGVYS